MKESIKVLIFAVVLPLIIFCTLVIACNPKEIKFGKELRQYEYDTIPARTCNIPFSNWTIIPLAYEYNAYLMSDNIDTEIGFYQNMKDNKWYVMKNDAKLYKLKTTSFNTKDELIQYIKLRFQ